MITFTKVSSVQTPAVNKMRMFYSSVKNCLAWLDENGTIRYFGQQRVVLAADLSASTTTTLADVTGLAFPVLANTMYGFEFCILYQTAATTTGIKLALTGPASPTLITASISIYGITSDGANAAASGTLKAFATDSVTSPSVEEASVTYPAYVRGRLVNGVNAGTLQLQWASEVSASGVTPKAGSSGEMWLL